MNTSELLTKAGEKLKETVIDFESDKKQFTELTKERGDLLALELIESKKENKEKITKLNKTITDLKTIIEDTPVIIDGLKKAKLRLASQKEKEDKDQAKTSQIEIEILLNKTSLKLIPLLKEVVKLNLKLKEDWANWDKLDTISGKGLTDTKVLRPSEQMLDRVCETFLDEWLGRSSETRRYYSKDKFRETKIIF